MHAKNSLLTVDMKCKGSRTDNEPRNSSTLRAIKAVPTQGKELHESCVRRRGIEMLVSQTETF